MGEFIVGAINFCCRSQDRSDWVKLKGKGSRLEVSLPDKKD